jgi:hypothetical protein
VKNTGKWPRFRAQKPIEFGWTNICIRCFFWLLLHKLCSLFFHMIQIYKPNLQARFFRKHRIIDPGEYSHPCNATYLQ